MTRSTGMGWVLAGSAAFRAAMRALTASSRAGLVGPRLEPEEAAALYGYGPVAERRPQKYLGSSNGWPISVEPTVCPFCDDQAAIGLAGKNELGNPGDHQRIDQTGQDRENE